MKWWMARLVRLYPRRWRERYEAELAALIEDSGADWRSAVDVVRGATLMQLAYGAATVRQHARRLAATPAFTLTAFVTLATYTAGRRGLPVWPLATVGGIAGFLIALVTVFKPAWAQVTGFLYAIAEGLLLGAVSAGFEARYPGIAISAAGCTIGTLTGLLLAYQSGFIRATENFKLGVFAATAGIALLYLVSFGLGLFGIRIPYLHEGGWIGIGFSAFVVVVAALNLVLDFDFIENGAARGAPKYMEWYAAFGLLVTLVWLYLEILRLLAKIMGRRD